MIASLPMYARASNRDAHDALWALIRDGLRDRGIAAPDALDHQIGEMDSWAHPDLVLGQICNLPYRALFRGKVTLIGAAHHDLPDCAPGYYHSVFVVRADSASTSVRDFATARFACNDRMSNSGYGAPLHWAQNQGFALTPSLFTGSHAQSIAAVAQGDADIAAIDAQVWWIEQRENPLCTGLRVIGRTYASAGLSFITRAGQDPAPYFAAIDQAIRDLAPAQCAALNLYGIIALPESAYDLPLPPPK